MIVYLAVNAANDVPNSLTTAHTAQRTQNDIKSNSHSIKSNYLIYAVNAANIFWRVSLSHEYDKRRSAVQLNKKNISKCFVLSGFINANLHT